MSLDDVRWLAGLPLAAVVVWLGYRSRAPDHATWTRATAVVLVVLALAGPRAHTSGDGLDVAFLVDESASISPGARQAASQWITTATGARAPGDGAALARFGRDARVEYGLTTDPPPPSPVMVADPTATDLGRALRLAGGMLSTPNRRRVVLITDGRQTQGDLLAGVRDLTAAGVGLDIVRLPEAVVSDVLIDELRAPARIREGEAYDVVVVLRNTGTEPAEVALTLRADEEEADRRTVIAPPGRSEVPIPRTAGGPGTVRYDVRMHSGASRVLTNDVGRAAVQVDGPPRVLVYQRTAGLAEDLSRALEAAGVPAELRSADAEPLPPLDTLLAYDSLVLVDIPAGALGEEGMVALDQYVRDAGHGLVAIGGGASFGMGGYDGTRLEELLPVFARVSDPQRRRSVAEALVVDTSGSMAACHCADEGAFGPPPRQGGSSKTDIAKEAIVRAAEQLEATDLLGVLAFNTESEWVLPLQRLPADSALDESLARLHPEGNTEIAQAIREAIAGLKDVEARLRHIVLFSDGFQGNTHGLEDVAREAADAGITLSVVGTGEGSFDVLRRMAVAGGGRYYPGRSLSEIPDIIALELEQVARPVVNEGRFYPAIVGLAPATEVLSETPPLAGYVATTAKPAANTLLQIGEHDPLLATWQAGLGTTTAWTSDAAARWSAQWLTWDRYQQFWAAVVKDTFPPGGDPEVEVQATATTGGLRINLELATPAADAEASATVTGPDGRRHQVRLDRTSLGTFEGMVAADAEGVYAVTAALRGRGEQVLRSTATAIRSYPAEYAVTDADPELLRRAVEAAGGRLDPMPGEIFERGGLTPGTTAVPVWPPLAAAALVLAVADVGLRRLRLERADLERLRFWKRTPG